MGAPRPRSQSELQIQRSQASILELSWELSINPKTVAKWRKQQTIKDPKTGSREPRSTVLSQAVEGMIVAFRRQTLLPLDDCLFPSAIDPTSNTISPASVSAKGRAYRASPTLRVISQSDGSLSYTPSASFIISLLV